jgi:hypothetical protein
MSSVKPIIDTLLSEVRTLVISARNAAARTINTLQVLTNYQIGRLIVEHEQKGKERAKYGANLLRELSAQLTKEFGLGFSEDNLSNMRRFYLVYKARLPVISEKPSRKSTEKQKAPLNLSWSHYVFLCRINNEKERSFYVRLEGENPTVGIVLCKKKRDALVEITLPKDAQIYASEYQLYLPSKEELRQKVIEWAEETGPMK